MLPSQFRMRKSSDFALTFKNSIRVGARHIVIHLGVKQADLECSRVGFVVSKSLGNAVTRNRVKRQIRHILLKNSEVLPEKSYLVVRALPGANNCDFRQLEAEIIGALESAKQKQSTPSKQTSKANKLEVLTALQTVTDLKRNRKRTFKTKIS